ncbi:hypothetical protein EVAR_78836_1 [Eumeta japonica]|uniref:Uncharacterized protein n=1 Tax=Eumeta variegata TaxID=151549 RepID=A0A4C1ZDX9_EUMVA|nr:hypothetical protein EVAR_78836_1 [Eumeta japonica]
MSNWLDWMGPSRSGAGGGGPTAEHRPLMMALRVPRSYGSMFPYYKFIRDALTESLHNETVSDWSYSRGGVCQPGPDLRGLLPHLPLVLRPTSKPVHLCLERNETDKFEKRLTTRPSPKLLAV